MYVNDVVFCIWIIATIFALFILVAWLVIKICGFIRGTKYGIDRLKSEMQQIERSSTNASDLALAMAKNLDARVDKVEENQRVLKESLNKVLKESLDVIIGGEI